MNDKSSQDVELRYSDLSDGKYLKEWLHDPTVARWFPMFDNVEIDDAVARWIGFARYKCSLTAIKNGIPVGICTLYLQPYKKLAHQCELGIIVAPDMRAQGVGTLLMTNIIHLAKENFNIELLHLQVYAENPAIHLYERMGFKEFGKQTHWIKENDDFYVGRVFMERFI